jgi:pyruvate formate lyase activating enzyme
MREGDVMVLTTYGRSSGFCIDPIEKKPLNHFYPGSSVLSFGTAGCNLACKFCQNWDISKSRDMDRLMDQASPEADRRAAAAAGCRSVAFTYNDPVIFAEYAMDVADACHALGVQTVAVTAGYIHEQPRREFFAKMDAANVDLKALHRRLLRQAHRLPSAAGARHAGLPEARDDVWVEITTLLIPGHNDSDTRSSR